MKDPTSKVELLQAIHTARNEWNALIAQIPPHRLSESGAAGLWSINDVIAHVTEYDRWLALGLALRLQKPPQIWLDDISLDEFNAVLHQQIADRHPDDILLDSNRVFQDLIKEVEAHSEAYLFGTHRVEGVSNDVIPFQLLKRESYGHYRDHIPAIRAWLSSHSQDPAWCSRLPMYCIPIAIYRTGTKPPNTALQPAREAARVELQVAILRRGAETMERGKTRHHAGK